MGPRTHRSRRARRSTPSPCRRRWSCWRRGPGWAAKRQGDAPSPRRPRPSAAPQRPGSAPPHRPEVSSVAMIDQITAANSWLNGYVWGWPMIVLLVGTGVLLTLVTGGAQFRYLPFALREVLGKIT